MSRSCGVQHGSQTWQTWHLQGDVYMDRAADQQRDLETARSQLEGKIATNDFDVLHCHHGVDKTAVKAIAE